MKSKIRVSREIEEVSSKLDYGRDIEINKLIDFLQMYKETYEGNGWDKLTIDFRKMDWDDDLEITIDGSRLETDDEFEDRMKREEADEIRRKEQIVQDKIRQEMQDRADYERLKRKFEQ